jgi:hypothetical protein
MSILENHSDSKWLSDPEGRIRNISLAPHAKNSLFPLFEAIMNSIHAIEELFGKDGLSSGHIEITIIRDEDDNCTGFEVTDNGIGFTKDNLESFVKMDSQKKVQIGGKGVGRLLWLKVAESVKVRSQYEESGQAKAMSFEFCLADPISNMETEDLSKVTQIGTTVEINPYRDSYARVIPKRAATIASRTLAHFISYFVNISQPKILFYDGDEIIDLFDEFSDSTERDEDFKFNLTIADEKHEFVVHCFLLPKAISDDEKSTNALYLGANGRAVRRFDMDNVLGLKAINGKYAFLGYVESKILNTTANDTRTDFSLSDDDILEIVDLSKNKAKKFLEPEISEIRDKQKKVVAALRTEHPRFLSVTQDVDAASNDLHLSMQKEEEIYVELSRQSLRSYKRRKSAFQKSVKKQLPDIETKAKEYVDGLQGESVASLAEYVMKRKLILEVFESSLKYKDVEKQSSEYENVVHDIICPLGSTSEELDYDDHNLWIVDDRLAFYSYFNSDKQMKAQIKDSGKPLDRPDLSIFDLGIGLQNDDVSQPITIIEFKRPKRDDYTLEKNPITQVRRYVSDMRQSKQAIKYDGTPLRAIDDVTPFMCHIVADITPSLESTMKDLGDFHQKAGTRTYYSWDRQYKIFIEISSFKDILDNAKARNKAFFEKLGIGP